MRAEHTRQLDELNTENERLLEKIDGARANRDGGATPRGSNHNSLWRSSVGSCGFLMRGLRVRIARPHCSLTRWGRAAVAAAHRVASELMELTKEYDDFVAQSKIARKSMHDHLVSELDVLTVHKEALEQQLKELNDHLAKKLTELQED